MKLCLFGDFDPTYNRNRVLVRGLESAGATCIVCRVSLRGVRDIFRALHDIKKVAASVDAVVVLYSDSRVWVPLLRVFTGAPIIWDAFFSRYDAIINDRKLAGRYSLKALYHWVADWLSVHLATYVILDTHEHIRYFRDTFGRSEDTYIRVLVGAEDPRKISKYICNT